MAEGIPALFLLNPVSNSFGVYFEGFRRFRVRGLGFGGVGFGDPEAQDLKCSGPSGVPDDRGLRGPEP